MLIGIIILPLLFALYALIRMRWLTYKMATHMIVSTWYSYVKASGSVTLDELMRLWPSGQIFWEFWNWSWPRYVVHQGLHDEVQEWLAEQLQRTDLTWERVMEELEEAGVDMELATENLSNMAKGAGRN